MPIINSLEVSSLALVCSRQLFIEAIKNGDEQFLKNNYYPASYYNICDEDSNSVLHLAVASGNEVLVRKILADGVKPDIFNNKKQSPLHLAASKNHLSLISILLAENADPNRQDIDGNTPLHLACHNYQNIKSIKILLGSGAKATLKNKRGFSPLVNLLPTWPERMSKQEFDQLCVAMKLLMQYGAKDNFRYEFGFDNFVSCAEPEHVDILIKAGANIESRCHKHTPLLRAASLGKTAMVILLLQSGANINAITTNTGESALHLAAKYGHRDTVEILLMLGANPNMRKDPLNPQWLQNQLLLSVFSKNGQVNKKTYYETPLHVATENGNTEIVSLLINAGAEVNAIAQYGTPLHYAINGVNSIFKCETTDHVKTVKLLLECGADINMEYDNGFEQSMSPLETAKKLIYSVDTKWQKILNEIIELLLVEHTKLMDRNYCTYEYRY